MSIVHSSSSWVLILVMPFCFMTRQSSLSRLSTSPDDEVIGAVAAVVFLLKFMC